MSYSELLNISGPQSPSFFHLFMEYLLSLSLQLRVQIRLFFFFAVFLYLNYAISVPIKLTILRKNYNTADKDTEKQVKQLSYTTRKNVKQHISGKKTGTKYQQLTFLTSWQRQRTWALILFLEKPKIKGFFLKKEKCLKVKESGKVEKSNILESKMKNLEDERKVNQC